MTARRKTTERALDRAWSALGRMGEPIQRDEIRGELTGAEDVEAGLDAMATALSDLKELDLGAAPLDEVLAEIGAEDDLIETTAQLINLVGRANYAGGLSREDIATAESCREELLAALDDLLNELKAEQKND